MDNFLDEMTLMMVEALFLKAKKSHIAQELRKMIVYKHILIKTKSWWSTKGYNTSNEVTLMMLEDLRLEHLP